MGQGRVQRLLNSKQNWKKQLRGTQAIAAGDIIEDWVEKTAYNVESEEKWKERGWDMSILLMIAIIFKKAHNILEMMSLIDK